MYCFHKSCNGRNSSYLQNKAPRLFFSKTHILQHRLKQLHVALKFQERSPNSWALHPLSLKPIKGTSNYRIYPSRVRKSTAGNSASLPVTVNSNWTKTILTICSSFILYLNYLFFTQIHNIKLEAKSTIQIVIF